MHQITMYPWSLRDDQRTDADIDRAPMILLAHDSEATAGYC